MEIPFNTMKILLALNLVLLINFVSASPNNDFDKGDPCILKDNVYGTCKVITECDYAKQLFRQRKTPEIMSYRCRFIGRMPLVCCPLPASRIDEVEVPTTEKIVETTTTEAPTTTTTKAIVKVDDYEEEDNKIETSIEIEQVQESSSTEAPAPITTTTSEESSTVAIRTAGLSKYQKALCENETPDIQLGLNIIGGEKADIGEFTFQAAIGYRKADDGEIEDDNPIKYLCGGSLIADDVVISAAHCFSSKQFTPEVVKVGRTSLNDDDENDYSEGDDVEIDYVKLHPEYSRVNKFNDIALIKLKRAVNDTRFPIIKPICLSINDDNLPVNFTITGFGRNDVDTKTTSDWLLKATVNEISHEKCDEMMQGTTKIIETQTCALGHKGADSCQGDSGGPMSFEKDYRGGKLTYLHGIVSYGPSCGSALPGIYTKVNKYLDWIEKEMNLMEQLEYLQNGEKCETFDGSEGVCVDIRNCNILYDQLKNGIIKRNQVKICNDATRFVCCPTSSVEERSTWDFNEACGKPVIGFGTVFYGTQIKRGAYPWLAALVETETDKFFCGGTLVSKNYVVTAAHCIEGKQRFHLFKAKDIFVILGGHNLETKNEPGRITASVRDIYVHHEWNPNLATYDADIAIVKLEEPVAFSNYIQPICIAAPKSDAASKAEGLIVGFGRSEHKKVENIARVITSPIYSYQLCANSSSHETLLTHRTFCGGFPNGTNVCEGDSGSGFIVKHNGIYYLRGIVSAALYDTLIGCNIESYSIFTDVLEFYSWVTSGKDDKILLQTILEENRKLLLNITRCQQSSTNQEILFQNLKEEIEKLKAHTTTESPISLVSNEFLTFHPKSTKFEKAICRNVDNKPSKIKSFQGNLPADVGEFPFHVALGYEANNNKTDYKCGGSLIADDLILTAAHCAKHEPVTVKLGRTSLITDQRDFGKGEDIGIKDIVIHPGYSRYSRQNDIALLKLKEPTNFTWPIQTICLSSSDENLPANFSFSSFGVINPDSTIKTNWLSKTIGFIYSIEQCQNFFKETSHRNVTTKQFCSLSYGFNCRGSSGGALSYKNEKGNYYIYGIASYGIGCVSEFPETYTKVNQYLEWIDEEMYKFEQNE